MSKSDDQAALKNKFRNSKKMEDFYTNKKIIEGLDALIAKVNDRLNTYKDDNVDFAELVYTEGLGEIFEPGGSFREYEQYFRGTIDHLEKKIRLLKRLRENLLLKNLLLFEPCRMN